MSGMLDNRPPMLVVALLWVLQALSLAFALVLLALLYAGALALFGIPAYLIAGPTAFAVVAGVLVIVFVLRL